MRTRKLTYSEQVLTGILIGLMATPSSLLAAPIAGPFARRPATRTSRWASGTNTSAAPYRSAAIPNENSERVQSVNWTLVSSEVNGSPPSGNTPPSLQPITNQIVNVGQRLFVEVQATDPDILGSSLEFTLLEHPPDADLWPLDATNAVIGWTPERDDTDSTNMFTVMVADHDEPSLSDTQTFAVIVTKYAQTTLGTLVLSAGQDGCLPITLDAVEPITNATFTLHWPAGTLTNVTLHPRLPEICASRLEAVAPDEWLLSLSTCPEQSLILTQAVEAAELCFTAVPGQTSAFVPVLISDPTVRTGNGNLITNQASNPGRVVVVGDQPLLEASFTSEGQPHLFLYGKPGRIYQIEATTNLVGPDSWYPACRVPMTTLAQPVCCVDFSAPTIFYRAYEFGTGPTNQAPLVNAGVDQVVHTNTTILIGSATDDGLPAGCKPLTYRWTNISGPGTVTFNSPTSAVTTATFSQPGTYVIQLSANDSQNTGTDEVNIAWDCSLSGLDDWQVTVSQQNVSAATQPGSVQFTNCEAILTEGDSFLVAIEKTFTVPTGAGLLCITYQGPTFDTTASNLMRDAFEASLMDSTGRPLAFTIQGPAGVTPASVATAPVLPASPDALFNHTDGQTPFLAPGSALQPSSVNPQLSTLFIDVSHLAPGSQAKLVLRLVNNDRDRTTSARIADVRFKPADANLNLTGSPSTALSLIVGSADESANNAECPGLVSFSSTGSTGGGKWVEGSGTAPDLAISSPAENATLPVAPRILNGYALAKTTTNGASAANHIVIVTINGQPVEALDAAGNFFSLVEILAGENHFEVVATDAVNRRTTNSITVHGTTCPQTFSSLGVVSSSIQPQYGRTSFNEWTKVLYADLALLNAGNSAIHAPFYVGVTRISDPTVRLLSPDGVSADGVPFYDFTATLGGVTLQPAGVPLSTPAPGPTLAYSRSGNSLVLDWPASASNAVVQQASMLDPHWTWFDVFTATGGANQFRVPMEGDPKAFRLRLPQQTALNRTLAFSNPNKVQFTYDLVILGQLNQSPYFTTTPPTEVISGRQYIYDGETVDPDGDALVYSLLESPPGMTIQTSTGLISWSATNGIGTYAVRLRADDGRGGFAEQRYQISVVPTPSNRPPYFSSKPVAIARVGTNYLYDANALDPDGDALAYAFVTSPSNMTINPVTGEIMWSPSAAQLGSNSVSIAVSDGRGGSDQQSYVLCVLPAEGNRPPIIVSQPITEYLLVPFSPSNSITLDMRVRDFNDDHPDFEGCINFVVATGIVQSVLGPDGTPLFAGTNPRGCVTGSNSFYHWFHDVPGTNLTAVLSLTWTETSAGSGIYSYTNDAFFPIDNQLFGNEGRSNNFHFTVELHSTFLYRGGEVFSFSGDDDTWVFIDKQLVVDLGGVYANASRSLNLDALGLVPGRRYSFDLFTAERSTGGSIQGMRAALELFGGQYSTRISAIDPENDSLTYELTTAQPGMLIDSTTGRITWNPGNADLGTHAVKVRVSDSRGGTAEQDFAITVIAPESGVITGTAFNDSNTNGLHDVSASEPGLGAWIVFIDQNQNHRRDEGELSTTTASTGQYALSNLAAGTYSVQLVSPGGWVPTTPSYGLHVITLTNGHTVLTADFGMQPRTNSLNSSPRFVSQPPTNPVAPGSILLYQAAASDAEGDILAFDLVVKPDGMMIERNSGLVAWQPTLKQLGIHDVILRVQDGRGGVALQTFLTTVATNPPPVITTIPPGQAVVGLPLQYIIRAQDPDSQVLSFSLASVTALTLRHFEIGIGDTVTNGVPGPGAGNIEIAYQHDIYTFTAAAGQKVFFDVLALAGAAGNVYWKLSHESGAVVFPPRVLGSGDPAAITLTNGGMYTIDVGRDDRSDTGTYSFRLTDVPAPDVFVIAIDGTVTNGVPGPGAGNIETPGVQDIYTFTADAGQKVFFDSLVLANINWKANHESGTVVFQRRAFGSGDPGVITLTNGGTYIIEVGRDDQADVGTYSFKPWNVPAPDEFAITVGDTVTNGVPGPGAGNIQSPGTHDIYTFTAAAGQQVFFDVLGQQGTDSIYWKVTDESGALVFPRRTLGSGDPGVQTLTRGGSYIIDVGRDDIPSTGTYSFRLTNVTAFALFAAPAEAIDDENPAPPEDLQAAAPEPGGAIQPAGEINSSDTNAAAGVTLVPFASNAQTPGSGGAVLSWTPDLSNIGTYRIELIVRDSDGAETRQIFNLEVVASAPNHAPAIASTPRSSIRLGMTYGYQISGIDSDGDPLQYHLGPCCLPAPFNQVAWWRAEGGALDSQGTNHGLLSNGVTFATGQIGQAFSFDGIDDKVSIPESPATDLSQMTNWMIEAWVKPLRFTGSPTIYSEGRWGASLGLQTSTGKPESRINNANQFVATIALQSNQWNHVALVYNGASRTFYVNGVFAGIAATPAITPDTNGAAIGDVTHNPSSSRFAGQIDELALYSRPLAALEIQAIYSAGAIGKCTNSQQTVGPAGLVLDPSGLLLWTPTPDQLGTHHVQICADDGRGGFASQSLTIIVSSTLSNQPPAVVSNPPRQATADQLYQYNLAASDPDNDGVTWRLVSGPVGMSIDHATGSLRWTPALEQLGVNSVTVEVQDVLLATATQSWTIDVGCFNRPPLISSVPATEAHVGEPYLYALSASDPDGDPLTFSFPDTNQIPAGMTLSNLTTAATVSPSPGGEGQGEGGSGIGGALISWTPGTNQVGFYLIRLAVSDGRGGTDTQNYTLYVSDLHANKAPFIVSTPQTGAGVGQPYAYLLRASDPDGDALTLQSLVPLPAGATFTPSGEGRGEGVLSWIPSQAQLGSHEFILTAQDPSAASASQRFIVTVRSNTAPQILSSPGTNGIPNLTYQYDVVVSDPDGDPLTFALTGPSGMTIDSLGRIAWTPLQTGVQAVTVTVTDGFGGTAVQTFNLIVAADTEPPSVSLSVSYNLQDSQGNLYVLAGTEVPVWVNASDNVGIAALELRIDGIAVPVNAGGSTMVPFPQPGSIEAIAQARDLAGNLASFTNRIPVMDPYATNTVHVLILSPTNSAEVTRPVDVVATITSEAPLAEYRVDYAEWDLSDSTLEVMVSDPRLHYQTITNVTLPLGTPGLTNAVLARFDPTLLLNGGYIIRVTAYDQNRQGRQEGVFVNVMGNLKFGEFRLEFSDLVVPVAGIPITVKRIYDSRDSTRQGDFGYGWSLGISDAHLLEVGKSSFSGLEGSGTTFTAITRVYMTTPDGRRVGFSFAPEFSGAAFLFGAFYKPAFKADPGVYEILEPLTAPAAYQFDSRGRFTGLFGLTGYTPEGYRLKTKDNLEYVYDKDSGLKSVTDSNGNNIQYMRDGILHYSAGSTNVDQSILFVRDASGRITQIIDPDGRYLNYTYDAYGDLRAFTNQSTNVSQYIYHAQRAHYLTNMIDPLGRNALRMEYDASGRLVSLTDATGNPLRQDFNTDTLTGIVTDANTNVTILQYDPRGNETMLVLEGVYTNRMEYDANNNLTRFENGRGYATNFTYDANGNRTSVTDALSNQTFIAYNAQNKPVAITNALGQTVNLRYDTAGNLIELVNNAGFQTVLAHDSQGRVVSVTDAAGNTTTLDYAGGCSCGAPGKVINPDGSFRLYEYNSLGQTNRLVNELGAETLFAYDGLGKLLWTRDALSNYTRFYYNSGLLTNIVDALGRSTRYEYDALNRTSKLFNAGGGVVEFRYDNNGNLTHVIDPLLNDTRFVYDSADHLTQQIDPLGHTNFFTYDAAGNRTEIIDRNGRRRTFAYDALNRMTNELWWDGANVVRSIVSGYNELGIQTLVSDPAARYDFTYDGLNRLQRMAQSSVPGQPDFNLTYTYTALHQLESVTDNYGVSVGSSYDNRYRLSSRTWQGPGVGPARVNFTYDAAGYRTRIDRFADLAGATQVGFSTNAYNLAGSVINITHLGPATDALARHDYTRDAAQQITQWSINSQPSTFNYDSTGQLTNALNTAQPNESFRYDANGNRSGVQPSGNYLVGTNNQILSDGTNNYAFDASGSMIARSNNITGVLTEYSFDHRNRLTTVLDHNPAGVVTQTVTFIYDALDRRIAKTVNGQTARFLYDNNNAWADLDASNTATAHYLTGANIDELLARQRPGEGQAWYLTDHLGTVRDIADFAGTLVAHAAYDAFGLMIGVSGNGVFDRFQFTGREFDAEMGLHYYRARYYNQNIGRFMSQDPIEFDSGDVNLYRYVGNSPLDSTDPTGQQDVIERGVVATAEGPFIIRTIHYSGGQIGCTAARVAFTVARAAAPISSTPAAAALAAACAAFGAWPPVIF